MVLGAIRHSSDRSREIADRIRDAKERNGLSRDSEVKWTKVSTTALPAYKRIVDVLLDDPTIRFRAVIVPDKSILDHGSHEQTHDDFYYKMYFRLLERIVDPACGNRIFLDIKDTKGGQKTRKLQEVLSNRFFDREHKIIVSIDQVRSDQVEQVQLADLLIGAIAYATKGLRSSEAKRALVEHIKAKTGLSLSQTTSGEHARLDILRWRPAT